MDAVAGYRVVMTAMMTISNRPAARLDAVDAARVLARVLTPLVARGVIKRRPTVVGWLERSDADRRAVECLQSIRRRYGAGPAVIALPGRTMAVILHPDDAWEVLRRSPDPFSPASFEKRAALSHFQPHGVLISEGADRDRRRALNDLALEPDRRIHHLSPRLAEVVRDETHRLTAALGPNGRLGWAEFERYWWRLVRRVVFGDAAADEHAVTDLVTELREAANWAFMRPKRRRTLAEFQQCTASLLEQAGPDTLGGILWDAASSERDAPVDQVAHWLFAFDAAALTSIRALAMIATSGSADRVRDEVVAASSPDDLRFSRACILETLRSWPTTPAILREQTREVAWGDGGASTPTGTHVVIYAPLFHRDDERDPSLNRFVPDRWLEIDDLLELAQASALVPFSAGPAACPGRNVVLTLTSLVLAEFLGSHDVTVGSPADLDADSMRSVLDPFTIELALRPRSNSEPRQRYTTTAARV
jgi:cytochrome P450